MSLLTFILWLCSGFAFAGKVEATDEQQEQIMKYVRQGLDAYKDFKSALSKEEVLRVKFKNSGNKLSEYDEQEWYRVDRQRREYEIRMNDALNEALRLTGAAYKVGPYYTTSPVANGPARGLIAHWKPKFYHDDKRFIQIESQDGTKHYTGARFDSTWAGATAPDGETLILIGNFQAADQNGHPGDLAYILHHEAFHFNELVTKGWDSQAGKEARAYTDSLKDLDRFIDKAKYPGHHAAAEKYLRGKKDEAIADLRKDPITTYFPIPEEKEKEYKNEFFNEALKKTMVDVMRRDIKDILVKKHFEAIDRLAANSCANPGGVSEKDIEGLKFLDRSEYIQAPAPVQPGDCKGKLYIEMLDRLGRGAGVDASWMNAVLQRYEREERRRQDEQTAILRQVKLSWDWLRGMAASACANPSSLTDDNDKIIHIAHGWLSREGPKFGVPSPEAVVGGLADCPKELLLKIIQYENSGLAVLPGIYRDAAAELSRKYRPPSPSQGADEGPERSGRDGSGGRQGRSCDSLSNCRPPSNWN